MIYSWDIFKKWKIPLLESMLFLGVGAHSYRDTFPQGHRCATAISSLPIIDTPMNQAQKKFGDPELAQYISWKAHDCGELRSKTVAQRFKSLCSDRFDEFWNCFALKMTKIVSESSNNIETCGGDWNSTGHAILHIVCQNNQNLGVQHDLAEAFSMRSWSRNAMFWASSGSPNSSWAWFIVVSTIGKLCIRAAHRFHPGDVLRLECAPSHKNSWVPKREFFTFCKISRK